MELCAMRAVRVSWADPTLFNIAPDEDTIKFTLKNDAAVAHMWQLQTMEFHQQFCRSFKAHCYYMDNLHEILKDNPKRQLQVEAVFSFIEQHLVFDRTLAKAYLEKSVIMFIIMQGKLSGLKDLRSIIPFVSTFETHAKAADIKFMLGELKFIDSCEQLIITLPLFMKMTLAICEFYKRWHVAPTPDVLLDDYFAVSPRYVPPCLRTYDSEYPPDFYHDCYMRELERGHPFGPSQLNCWIYEDPRFTDNHNPMFILQDGMKSDWRCTMQMEKYSAFLDYAFKKAKGYVQQMPYLLVGSTDYWKEPEIVDMLNTALSSFSLDNVPESFSELGKSLPMHMKQAPSHWPIVLACMKPTTKEPVDKTVMPKVSEHRWMAELSRWASACAYLTDNPDVNIYVLAQAAAMIDRSCKKHISHKNTQVMNYNNFCLRLATAKSSLTTTFPEPSKERKTIADNRIQEKDRIARAAADKTRPVKSSFNLSAKEIRRRLLDESIMMEHIVKCCKSLGQQLKAKSEEDRKFLLLKQVEYRYMFHVIGPDNVHQKKWNNLLKETFSKGFKTFLEAESDDAKEIFPASVEECMARKKKYKRGKGAAAAESNSSDSKGASSSNGPAVSNGGTTTTEDFTKKHVVSGPLRPLSHKVKKANIHPNEPLKKCSHCGLKEKEPLDFHCCVKCFYERVKHPRHYCCEECRRLSWYTCHGLEHKDGKLEIRPEGDDPDLEFYEKLFREEDMAMLHR